MVKIRKFIAKWGRVGEVKWAWKDQAVAKALQGHRLYPISFFKVEGKGESDDNQTRLLPKLDVGQT